MFNLMFNPMLNLKFRLFFAALICFALFSAAGAKAQTVTAPALEPSKAKSSAPPERTRKYRLKARLWKNWRPKG